VIRIAAIGEIHVTEGGGGKLRSHFMALQGRADVLLLDTAAICDLHAGRGTKNATRGHPRMGLRSKIMATETSNKSTQQSSGSGTTAESGQQQQRAQQGTPGQQGTQGQGGTQEQQGTQGSAGGQGLQGSGRGEQQGRQGAMQRRGQQGVARYSRNPLAVMQQLSNEVDSLLESFFYGTPQAQSPAPTLWVPQIEMREEGNQLRVSVDLPGVGKDSVRVDIEPGMLILQGERREERREGDEQQGFRRTERRYGSFYRAIPLPEGVDVENAQAEMKEGVLEIVLPLAQRKEGGRRLEIKS
jgi:HSP20 family protein